MTDDTREPGTGWRRVPVEPLAEQTDLAARRHAVSRSLAANIYRDMVTSAPASSRTPSAGGFAPAFDFLAYLAREREWSERVFGPGERTASVVEHIRRELAEIEAEPTDVEEWVDVIILAIDGAWRVGATPTVLADAILAKQAKNEARQWPDWRTIDITKPIEHMRDTAPPAAEQPARAGANLSPPGEGDSP
ncbi:dATP/dGTP pyrophosphohydrolase domain-containing protein [Chelatococcus reniformis]|uniref:dATP/dGTP diphosphohydrolase MazZ domain-containing protein n=1 Tax=Chelatococcus reniformis TaxID=1494448 RepID=A0A916XGL7_9HYPH|nr:dATP/dGTP pyrophosphohydrolase domain-containing protein [Chelatococcus reniformis]GGC70392.1 hypothetical protein GCM10010994_31140 [Chelatococcus reniformis]